MKIDIIIITGASKGIGSALYEQLTAQGKTVIGLARTNTNDLQQFVQTDLTELHTLPNIIKEMIERYRDQARSFTLINNAGTVEPIGLVGKIEAHKMGQATQLNLLAPMILCNTFIQELETFSGEKNIVNISSGAGRKPYAGWGVYCTTKAGLDHFSTVVYEEQKRASNPVNIVSIAPGIIDTNMQAVIRASEEEEFPLLERFKDYKTAGVLSSPAETASKLIAFYQSEKFKDSEPIVDIRTVK